MGARASRENLVVGAWEEADVLEVQRRCVCGAIPLLDEQVESASYIEIGAWRAESVAYSIPYDFLFEAPMDN